MKMNAIKKILVLFGCLIITQYLIAQEKEDVIEKDSTVRIYGGFGLGLDYGGVGINAIYSLKNHTGFFAGGGFNFVSPAWNAGIKVALPSLDSNGVVVPYLIGMYGYNAFIKKAFGSNGVGFFNKLEEKTYYGASFGAGIDIGSRKNKNWYLSISVIAPIRSKEFKDKLEYYKKQGYKFNPENPYPVLLSVGYHVRFLKKGE